MNTESKKVITYQDVLFKKNYEHNDKTLNPLVKTQKKLAELILNDKTNNFKSEGSLNSFISQWLNNVSPLSNNLHQAILCVAENLLTKISYLEFCNDFSNSISLEQQNHTSSITRVSELVKGLENWHEVATDLFVFSHSPAELKWQYNQRAKEIVQTLFDNCFGNNKDSNKTFRFYFPTIEVASKFWVKLYYFIVTETSYKDNLDEIPNMLISCDKIHVHVVENETFDIHTAYFEKRNKNQNQIASSLYVFSFHGKDEISINKLSEEDKLYWYKNKYLNIFNRVINSKKTIKIPFNENYKYLDLASISKD